ncbi:uncharacterized protein LOC127862963 [Dreissena polymorpha]|uniref:Uncharacterized protein n=1 Tax=Dreissena polymorpha TaxID=45954 RepID=A0A9D3Y9N3_DREPO|nr:uncharacterized protein LOC127862963 [Dreissena polymorpha]KAH3694544.1 hypothetical protein DPMN_081983 [Dreissena polymorpha]
MKFILVGILVVFVAFAAVASAKDDILSEQELREAVERAKEKPSNDESEDCETLCSELAKREDDSFDNEIFRECVDNVCEDHENGRSETARKRGWFRRVVRKIG